MIIEFQSAVSGMWYTQSGAAGEVSAIKIDGVLFTPAISECQHEWRHFSDMTNRQYSEDAASGRGEE